MFRTLAAAVVLVAAAAPAQVTAPETDGRASVKSDADKMVCKKVEKVGSRLGDKKVCLTVREWAARAHEDRNETNRVQTGAAVCNTICP